jgi:hypothetical protein
LREEVTSSSRVKFRGKVQIKIKIKVKVQVQIQIKIKGKVKGDGPECPSDTGKTGDQYELEKRCTVGAGSEIEVNGSG